MICWECFHVLQNKCKKCLLDHLSEGCVEAEIGVRVVAGERDPSSGVFLEEGFVALSQRIKVYLYRLMSIHCGVLGHYVRLIEVIRVVDEGAAKWIEHYWSVWT